MSSAASTPARERVPFASKVAAGVGEAGINIGVNLPKSFAFPLYNLVLGVNPTLLGMALMIPRIWDAVTDPVMGTISDNTRGRWGRRRPYIAAGGILAAASIVLLCVFPRDVVSWIGEGVWMGYKRVDWFYAAYLCAMSMVFYTALTVFSVPYGALTMELSSDYHERTRVMTFRTFFTYVSGMLIGWLYAIAQSERFVDPVTGERDPVRGAYAVGMIVGSVLLVACLTPAIFLRERPENSAPGRPKVRLWAGMSETLRVPAFLLIVGAYTVGFLGVVMVIGLGQYVNFFYVFGGDQQVGSVVQGWAHTMAVLMGMLTVVLINRFGHRFEKKTVLMVCLMMPIGGGLLSWFVYRPDAPMVQFTVLGVKVTLHALAISYAMIWPGLAGLLVMSSSMIADLCDLDELRTGSRREGMYWAVFNWIQKSALSLSLLLSGTILDWVGFDAKLPAQSEQTLTAMRLCYMAVVVGGIGLSLALVACVPLSRSKVLAAREELARRRAGPPAATA